MRRFLRCVSVYDGIHLRALGLLVLPQIFLAIITYLLLELASVTIFNIVGLECFDLLMRVLVLVDRSRGALVLQLPSILFWSSAFSLFG